MVSRPPQGHMERFMWFLEKSKIDFKQHQYDGVQWAVYNETRPDPPLSCRGGFIADEMGLGKTITTIGLIIANFMPCTLIVLPNVLLEQWSREIFRTTGRKPILFYGQNKKKLTIEMLQNAPIVITTYGIITQMNSILHQIKWSRVVFDEAHHLRNKNIYYNSAIHLKTNIRWLISGTPIQNRQQDFHNLCSVLSLPSTFYKKRENLPFIVSNFLLRRTKLDVGIQMPPLNIDRLSISWDNPSERILSKDIHDSLKTVAATDKLKLFIRARQVCILPAMLQTKLSSLTDNSLISKLNSQYHSEAIRSSSKIDNLISTLIQRYNNGNGKIIFCHFRQEIDVIHQRLLNAGVPSHLVAAFDGRTPFGKRAYQDFEFLILQIQTASEGLNLQAQYSEIYFVSPSWNPAIEEQAIARCHRIGQTKPVHVFKFYMDTFDLPQDSDQQEIQALSLDQYISLSQKSKREISDYILSPQHISPLTIQ